MKTRIAALASLILLSTAANTASAREPTLLSLSMEHFRDTATVKEDLAAGTTTITTEKGFVVRTGPMKMVWNDEYLKAVIDRSTDQKSFQVIAMSIYSGNRRLYQTANFSWLSAPKSVPAIQVSTQREACAVGDCTYTDIIAFAVDEDTLRQIAAQYVPGKPTLLAFKITAKPGPDFSGELSSAEIAGFLARVDQPTSPLPKPTVNAAIAKENAAIAKENAALAKENAALAQQNAALVKENSASASLKLDLGVAGIAVAATAEQPNRAGILVTAVNSGSVAQKSGIIIGDILYELDGHPIKELAQLEAAVAASAANSTVVIKLYRGTNKMALNARF
ncbi:MAG: PDZ domain-containing protein [Steroidobacteraceae bacterium]